MGYSLTYQNKVIDEFVHRHLKEVEDLVFRVRYENAASKDNIYQIIHFYSNALDHCYKEMSKAYETPDRHTLQLRVKHCITLTSQIKEFLSLRDPEEPKLFIVEKVWCDMLSYFFEKVNIVSVTAEALLEEMPI